MSKKLFRSHDDDDEEDDDAAQTNKSLPRANFILQDGFGFLKIMNSATRLGDLLDFGQFF